MKWLLMCTTQILLKRIHYGKQYCCCPSGFSRAFTLKTCFLIWSILSQSLNRSPNTIIGFCWHPFTEILHDSPWFVFSLAAMSETLTCLNTNMFLVNFGGHWCSQNSWWYQHHIPTSWLTPPPHFLNVFSFNDFCLVPYHRHRLIAMLFTL